MFQFWIRGGKKNDGEECCKFGYLKINVNSTPGKRERANLFPEAVRCASRCGEPFDPHTILLKCHNFPKWCTIASTSSATFFLGVNFAGEICANLFETIYLDFIKYLFFLKEIDSSFYKKNQVHDFSNRWCTI